MLILHGSNGTLVVLAPNPRQVSNGATENRWEPSSAARVGGPTWVTSWTQLNNPTSYVSSWNGAGWNPPVLLAILGQAAVSFADVYLSWDPIQSHFVFAALDSGRKDVYYGFSTDSAGTIWDSANYKKVLSADTRIIWDYPSIGVDAGGRIIIGAVSLLRSIDPPRADGFYTELSTDGGATFVGARVSNMCDQACGGQSRVIATNDKFHAFLPILDGNFLPTAVNRYESSTGLTWPADPTQIVHTFSAPLNNSPDNYPTPSGSPIFYAPLLDAKGYTSGLWSVAFQLNNNGFNNVCICMSTFGCGIIVPDSQNDQFLAGTSVSGDGAFWVQYHTYDTTPGVPPRTLPLHTQAIFFPQNWPLGDPEIGATTNSGIIPTSWPLIDKRCVGRLCCGAGDYVGIASNPFASASTPFIMQSAGHNDLFQTFVIDPPVTSNVPNFKPNIWRFPFGSDVRSLGKPVPPQSVALPPGQKVGLPQLQR